MFYIRKSSGEKQRFDLQKFRRSLLKAGADDAIADSVVKTIQKEKPSSTRQIHTIATAVLQKKAPVIADRYNLKRALMSLGPDGYSFEQFIAHLLQKEGYQAITNQHISGACVDHEIDIVIEKENQRSIVECKFHNSLRAKSDVKIPLYVQARFEDIQEASSYTHSPRHRYNQAWLVTNTKFTSQAIIYGECKGIHMLGWGYPEKENIAFLIQKHQLYPITTLTSLHPYEKKIFMKNGFVLCKDAQEHEKTLRHLGIKPSAIKKIIAESQAVCAI